ncbi:methyltransferase domain-containing protein [Ectobacillus antri]|jgi:tRNA G10  N-methylase Trm11|uniref:Methyltransferase domain-containing protein n=1 Tax=Ectobacillus antri TaxID=2486280 RepID=A0ABT6H5G4_9BACI|nr:methyltransferase domain-containing protein [Ectobacillus antri]MDG4658073.1 methyltransferase domain-containing protein [Ectobacillus antri]MDG5753686.1 methyltransferase domain-containing protein [Ectobacillus antri]
MFVYTYACRPEEESLCQLELRALFGKQVTGTFLSERKIDPTRSPFIKERIDVLYESNDWQELKQLVSEIVMGETTFKVICIRNPGDEKIPHDDRRAAEREIGTWINGEANVKAPMHIFGLVRLHGKWYFGDYHKSVPVWLGHVKKPREYSTALDTRLARAVANIAAPVIEGVTIIDPCCGIGTVLVEALSMGMHITGRDINYHAVSGARENIAHFGFSGEVKRGPISEVNEHYDVAILDMPYNLCTHATPDDQLDILRHARRFCNRAVVVTMDRIDEMMIEAGFKIIDRAIVKKGSFTREVVVCQ